MEVSAGYGGGGEEREAGARRPWGGRGEKRQRKAMVAAPQRRRRAGHVHTPLSPPHKVRTSEHARTQTHTNPHTGTQKWHA